MKFTTIFITIAEILLLGSIAAARNPIIDQGLADPSVKVFDGRAYIYGTHDFSPANTTWVAKDWHVFSSNDLVTWVDAGVALDDDLLAWRPVNDRNWAPDAIGFGSQFYFYFTLGDERKGLLDTIGVAAGASPSGPFVDILGRPLVDNSTTPTRSIDPMAFEDVDGSRYLIWGNGAFFLAQLNDDMVSFKTSPQQVVVSGAPSYEEGPFVWFRGGKYYLLYSRCGGLCSDSLDYAIADTIRGPYTYRGTIVAHGKRGNEHGSVFEFKGQWYVAYHDLYPTNYFRKTRLDFLHYTDNGDIPQVYPTDYGVGRYDGSARIEAENYFDKSSNMSYEECSDGGDGFAVTSIANDSWLLFPHVEVTGSATSFQARISAQSNAGRIEIRVGGNTGALIGICDVAASDGAWQTVETTLSSPLEGVNDVALVFKGDAERRFKLNWIQFAGPGVIGDAGLDRSAEDSVGDSGCACMLDADGSPIDVPISLVMTAIAVGARNRRRNLVSKVVGSASRSLADR